MAAEPDITTRALQRTDYEEPKPLKVRWTCEHEDCQKAATRSDGMCAKHSELRLTTLEVKRRAKEFMERNAVKYAKLHMKAAEVAARDGDSKPALEGLLHTKTVEPLPKNEVSAGGGIVVQVGVLLPGLPGA